MISLNPQLFHLPNSEIKKFGKENLIYGSLTKNGVKTLVGAIQSVYNQDQNHVGLDLGCGDGELIYHLQKAMSDLVRC